MAEVLAKAVLVATEGPVGVYGTLAACADSVGVPEAPTGLAVPSFVAAAVSDAPAGLAHPLSPAVAMSKTPTGLVVSSGLAAAVS